MQARPDGPPPPSSRWAQLGISHFLYFRAISPGLGCLGISDFNFRTCIIKTLVFLQSSSAAAMALCSGKRRAKGEFPEFGAIFMSSRTTKHECLERKLFGLPIAFADFVKNVRAGMILFLFEYEKRKLYGVFQAVSDGQMDIVPHAYRSSGYFFPAQVRFRVVWNCRSLPEVDFRDAISDNYFQAYKFKFGLSKEQVHRLLCLFDFKRIKLQKAPVEKKPKKKHSSVSSNTGNLAIDSGEAGLRKAVLSFGNPLSPAAGITSSYNPTVNGPQNLTSELESDTHTGCASELESVFSAHRHAKLHEKIKHVDISPTFSLDLGDYIPLSSPECCDIEVDINAKPRVKALYSDSPEKRTNAFSRMKLYLQSAAQENEDNSQTLSRYLSESNQPNLLPKFVQQEEDKNFEAVDESVSEILEKLEQSHDNWMKMRERTLTKSFENSRNSSLSRKTSVFSRLSFASESTEQEKKVNVFCRLNLESQVHYNDEINTSMADSVNSVKDVSSESKKRKHDVSMENHDNSQSMSMRTKVNMLEKEYATAEDSPSRGKVQKQ
ncbi:hypothetical protein ACH5RR_038197 [Cinchona calisaya]|uniref:DCD domain-containing protein n=1 Tax=Cinchona calisaya TaxID=153742 RepID=A0ABD2YDV6_9GENT